MVTRGVRCGKEAITGRYDKVRSVTDGARNMSVMAGTPYGREGVDVTQCIQRLERAGVEKPLGGAEGPRLSPKSSKKLL